MVPELSEVATKPVRVWGYKLCSSLWFEVYLAIDPCICVVLVPLQLLVTSICMGLFYMEVDSLRVPPHLVTSELYHPGVRSSIVLQ